MASIDQALRSVEKQIKFEVYAGNNDNSYILSFELDIRDNNSSQYNKLKNHL